jgi:4-carboxymuconolactone decarboxylase
MNAAKVSLVALAVLLAACSTGKSRLPAVPKPADAQSVSPALAHNTESQLIGEVWERPGLSPRDRSLVTVTVLIVRGQTVEMPYHFNKALDNGVKPIELSETINHLAYYSGWGNATATLLIAKDVFANRGIGEDQLAPVAPRLMPIDQAAEKDRAARADQAAGMVSPGLVHYTTAALFNDLWLRPGLAPRDRSLITVSSLVANGQVGQIGYHLNRAMDNGLTQSEASEMITQLAFYAGWPNAFSAVPVFKEVFNARNKS